MGTEPERWRRMAAADGVEARAPAADGGPRQWMGTELEWQRWRMGRNQSGGGGWRQWMGTDPEWRRGGGWRRRIGAEPERRRRMGAKPERLRRMAATDGGGARAPTADGGIAAVDGDEARVAAVVAADGAESERRRWMRMGIGGRGGLGERREKDKRKNGL